MRVAACLLWLGVCLSLAAQTPAWRMAWPHPVQDAAKQDALLAAPVAALALAPNGVVYAGGVGGIWSYFNQTWTPLGAGAPVSALTISGGLLYAGTGEVGDGAPSRAGAGVLVSANGGSSWSTLGATALAGVAIASVAVDPANAAHLLVAAMAASDSPAGATGGIYASSDGGATWELASPAGDMSSLAWSGTFVLAAGARGLLNSGDDGASFQALAGLTGPAAVCGNPAGGFLALATGASGPELLAITSGGSQQAAWPLPPGLGTAGPAAIAALGQGIWISNGGDVWWSANQGQSWADVSLGTTAGGAARAIAPAADGSLWLATEQGAWFAPSGGGLEDANAGLDNAAPLALAWSPTGVLAALVGDGAAAGPLGTSGAWTVVSPGTLALLARDPADASGNSYYGAEPGGASLLHSTDGGATWQALSLPPPTAAVTALAAAADSAGGATVWVGTATGQVWASGDQGGSWTAVDAPTGTTPAAGLAAASGVLWLAAGGSVWSSGDGGATWTAAPSPGGEVRALDADPTAGGVAAAATSAGNFVLLPQATAWTALPGGLPAAPVTALRFDSEQTLWAATLGRGVWSVSLAQAGLAVAVTPGTASVTAGQSTMVTVTVTGLAGAVAGASVTLSLTGGGQAVWTSGALTTGSNGTVSASVPAPTAAGADAVTATAQGAWGMAQATAALTVLPGPAAAIRVLSGGGESATAGAVVDVELEAADAYGNPVPNIAMGLSGPGGFSPAAVTTDAAGDAWTAYTLPVAAGTVTVAASAGSLSATWTETALPPPGYTLTLSPPTAPVAVDSSQATFTLQVVPAGGFRGTVPLACSPECSLSSGSSSPPYAPVTVTVGLGTRPADQSSVSITVSSDSLHAATASIPLQGFSLAAGASAVNVAAGATAAELPLSVSGIHGFSGSVSFAAAMADGTALPSTVLALFHPSAVPVEANGSGASASLSISVASAAGDWPRGPWELVALAGLVGFALAGVRRRRLAVIAGLALACAGCGGGGGAAPVAAPPTTTATYMLQVTANAGVVSDSLPVTLTVTSR